ncbi:hypothetical protein EG328_009944 [Venturia inaequalis]|uniref:Uncharacterized protein n=1 Tax=Venturia inaequalis TaxID=5025 RepID=A0A8H3V9A9_VENIN|nr:hypothetical protein EG328_009944 [Venturia inaequalis]KAE9986128.1 hypothetical protein EG327_004459 [Venturia inaequalis]
MELSDESTSKAEWGKEFQASITPHHPTPPGSVSPTEHAQNFTFSSADDAIPVKKPAGRRKRGPASGGARKRQSRKKEPPIATQAVRGIQWSGFGTNHLPHHYPAIPAREAEEKAKEEKQARELNRTHDPEYDPIQYLVYLIHAPTGMEFSVPRELLRGVLADTVAQGIIDNPNKKIDFELQDGTPAGLCLYVHVLIMGGEKTMPNLFHGAWEQIRKVHRELDDVSWVAVLLSGLLTAREVGDKAFEGLVVDELVKAGREALAADS